MLQALKQSEDKITQARMKERNKQPEKVGGTDHVKPFYLSAWRPCVCYHSVKLKHTDMLTGLFISLPNKADLH